MGGNLVFKPLLGPKKNYSSFQTFLDHTKKKKTKTKKNLKLFFLGFRTILHNLLKICVGFSTNYI